MIDPESPAYVEVQYETLRPGAIERKHENQGGVDEEEQHADVAQFIDPGFPSPSRRRGGI